MLPGIVGCTLPFRPGAECIFLVYLKVEMDPDLVQSPSVREPENPWRPKCVALAKSDGFVQSSKSQDSDPLTYESVHISNKSNYFKGAAWYG